MDKCRHSPVDDMLMQREILGLLREVRGALHEIRDDVREMKKRAETPINIVATVANSKRFD